MKAILRTARISPRKVNLVAGMVRGQPVEASLALLKFTPKRAAHLLYKVIHSAAANAQNNFNQSLRELVITKLLVTAGPTLKRWYPAARGRTRPIRKRTCHITVEVGALTPSAIPQPKAEPVQEPSPSAGTGFSEKPVKKSGSRISTPKKMMAAKGKMISKAPQRTSKTP